VLLPLRLAVFTLCTSTPQMASTASRISGLEADRAAEGRVIVVDEWGFDAPSTKAGVAALSALGLEGRVLVVLAADDVNAALSLRNIPEVQLITPAELNAYDVLCNDTVVFTSSTLPTSATAESDAS
jgi:large subunit ribosomal protein L4